MNYKSEFINEINNRGFIYQSSDLSDLDSLMHTESITAYIGFDITSDSLHIGSLVQLMLLYWLDFYGHSPLALVGGGTTLVGDPSGKDKSRKILQQEDIDDNIKKIQKTFNQFIKLDKKAKIVNNYEWLSKINYINFLREIGSNITLNKMLTFESVKSRLDREQPLSILEFNYMLLQSYDFYYLNKNYNCKLQLGGSDQWGNIVSGVELIRKINNNKAYAITSPLITNSDGSKMGKTAEGAVWLDEDKFSSYNFFQFWRNIDDDSVSKFLYLFTTLPLSEIKKLSKLKNHEINEAKQILAYEVTKIVRGENKAKEALEISNNLFKSKITDNRINNYTIESNKIENKSFTIVDAIENLKLIKSRSEIKRLIKSRSVKVNDELFAKSDLYLDSYVKFKKIKITIGKKKIGFLNIVNN